MNKTIWHNISVKFLISLLGAYFQLYKDLTNLHIIYSFLSRMNPYSCFICASSSRSPFWNLVLTSIWCICKSNIKLMQIKHYQVYCSYRCMYVKIVDSFFLSISLSYQFNFISIEFTIGFIFPSKHPFTIIDLDLFSKSTISQVLLNIIESISSTIVSFQHMHSVK